MMVAILNSAILDSDTAILDSDTWLSSLRFTQNTLPPLWLWLNIIQSDSTSFILTQFDDGSFLEFCHLKLGHLGISHLSFSSQTHSPLPWLVPTICTKKTSLTLPSPTFAQEILHSFILTQLDDGGHLEICHLEFCHLGFSLCIVELRHLVFFSQIHSKTSPSTLTLIQTNSFWLKLIHSHWTWWWQPSWILPTWFQPFCTKNITHSFWLNLMMSTHLEYCQLGFNYCHLGFRHLVIFSPDSLQNALHPLWLWP